MSWFILILLGAIWGASYLFIAVGVKEIPPFTFVEGRALIAAIVLFVAMRWRGERLPRTRREWLPLIGMGIFNGVIPYTLITWGEIYISSGLAAILTAAMPMLGTAIAYILYYWLIENTGATRTSLVTYLIPITGVLWGAWLLNESIKWDALIGLALIVAGIGLVNRSATSQPRKGIGQPVD